MRAILHVLATLVLVPYFVLAGGFLILGHAISRGSLWSFLDALLAHAAWLIPWGILGLALALVAVAILGAIARARRLAAAILAMLAGASLAVILTIGRGEIDAGALLFLLPCALVLAFALGCLVMDRKGSLPVRAMAEAEID